MMPHSCWWPPRSLFHSHLMLPRALTNSSPELTLTSLDIVLVRGFLEEKAHLHGEKDGHPEQQEELAVGTLPERMEGLGRRKRGYLSVTAECEIDVKCRKKGWLTKSIRVYVTHGYRSLDLFLRTYFCSHGGDHSLRASSVFTEQSSEVN